ncbi:MAG: sugar ABC transporter permease [Clostridia bacterium]|nr:sugar ABC transporter permease [Clostridia bacterium]
MIVIKNKRSKLKLYLFIALMLSVSLLHFAIFYVYVNFDTVRLTFFRFDEIENGYVFNGFKNYADVIRHTFIEGRATDLNTFLNTFRAISVNLIILPISIITAYAFYKKVYAEKTFRVIFYLPSIISIVVQCSAFLAMFKTYTYNGEEFYGPYNQFFRLFGYAPEWLSTASEGNTMWPLIYAFGIIAGLGTNVILMSSAMLRIPSSITEAAELDGCGFYRELFTITLPLIMPTITTWITMIVTSVFGFFMQPMLLTEGARGTDNKFYTIPWQIFDQVQNGAAKSTIPAAATLGILLSLIIMPLVTLMRWIFKKLTPEVSF